MLGHVVLSVWGYALLDRISLPSEVSTMVLDRVAADYWRALYIAALLLLIAFRIVAPVVDAFRYRLRVTDVVHEGPGVVSLRIAGRGLHRLQACAGQFFLWRFLARGRWWASHPFSISEAPRGDSLRITVKALGDFTSRIAEIRPGTRVVAEGPFGTFTDAARRRDRAVVLIAGGIGITPIRSLIEEMGGDLIVLYRGVRGEDLIFRDELDRSETLQTQSANIDLVSGATDTSESYVQSLQAAILKAKRS